MIFISDITLIWAKYKRRNVNKRNKWISLENKQTKQEKKQQTTQQINETCFSLKGIFSLPACLNGITHIL